MTTDTIIAKIQLRRGQLDDLPVLDEAELGYATDHHRLFIGNKPITFKGDGVTRRFSIREADIIPNQTRVMVNSIDAYFDPALVSVDPNPASPTPGFIYTIEGTDVIFDQPPEYDANIVISFNSEVKIFNPQADKSIARLDTTMDDEYKRSSISWDMKLFNTAKLTYSYKTDMNIVVGEAYFIADSTKPDFPVNVLNANTSQLLDIQFWGEVEDDRFYIVYNNTTTPGNLYYNLELWYTA